MIPGEYLLAADPIELNAGRPTRRIDVTELGGVRAGVDLIAPRLLLARFLAGNGAPFGRARASYRSSALRSIFGGSELAGRK